MDPYAAVTAGEDPISLLWDDSSCLSHQDHRNVYPGCGVVGAKDRNGHPRQCWRKGGGLRMYLRVAAHLLQPLHLHRTDHEGLKKRRIWLDHLHRGLVAGELRGKVWCRGGSRCGGSRGGFLWRCRMLLGRGGCIIHTPC